MILASLVLSTVLAAGDAPLPPGHPAIGATPPGPTSPAGSAGQLPPNHPKLGAGDVSAEELIKKLDAAKDLETREKTFEVASALGKLYYSTARYADASKYLLDAEHRAEPALATLKEHGKKPAGGATAQSAGCEWTDKSKLQEQAETVRAKAKSGDGSAAAACARVGLEAVAAVHELRARALFLSSDADGAIAEFDQSLALAPGEGDALFGRAMTRLDAHGDEVRALKLVKEDFLKILEVAPDSRHAQSVPAELAWVNQAIAAGGLRALNEQRAAERKAHPVQVAAAAPMRMPPNHPPMAGGAPFAGGAESGSPPPLTKEMVDAVQNTERTPEMMAGLAKLVDEGEQHLAKGEFQDALDNYKRVVPFQPENGRAKAGMAWALVGLGKPMGDRVWMVAVGSDPSAVDKLGQSLKDKGDAKGAHALWQKLAQSAPDYAKQSDLSARAQ